MKQKKFTPSRVSTGTSVSQKYFINVLFGNKYTQHGIKIGNIKPDQCIQEKKIPYSGKGLEVCQSDPRLVAFLNGVIFKNGESVKLLEIKCLFIGQIISAENTEHHCQYLRK
ncbi:uncharacterized protein LOC123672293 [Harmonia axyridis]|uniref:uncharacterized protein LOC123672293 n=1 Tax=Harmonia axyridis TaxID=115357 RepID=UPI001E2780D3|nr:uncharacterized protein LOC123672293 [Harmonia axyridis]